MRTRIGIVGCGYGRSVLVPAFRTDPRSDVIAIAATNKEHAQRAASELRIHTACANWVALIEDKRVDAVVVATPPSEQPQIVIAALQQGKAVFAEKPMALNTDQAKTMRDLALAANLPNMIDFNFTEISTWKQARTIIRDGGIGALRHVTVHWHCENYSNRMRLKNWKSSSSHGGGALFNFVSHCLHYLEWFLGPIKGLFCRLSGMSNDERPGDTTVAMAFAFESGAEGNLSMSAASYLGSGHRVEFYGDDGALYLENPTADYMKGFKLLYGKRPETCLRSIGVEDPEEVKYIDGRILPTSRLACRFLDWLERGTRAQPDFNDGLRVQKLLEACRRSDEFSQWINIPS